MTKSVWMSGFVALLFTAIAGTTASSAQSNPKIDCENANSTVELNWCAEQEFNKADAHLNAVYKRALARIAVNSGTDKSEQEKWTAALRESQRLWVAFRNKDCGELIGFEWSGGTGMTAATLGCMSGKTKVRMKEVTDRYLAD